jgi:hypothetical protein
MPYLKQAIEHALAGNASAVDRALNAAGLTAVAAVKNRIVAGLSPPLRPATVRARRRRTKSRIATSPTHVTPLVDTGQFLNSISYVVRRK